MLVYQRVNPHFSLKSPNAKQRILSTSKGCAQTVPGTEPKAPMAPTPGPQCACSSGTNQDFPWFPMDFWASKIHLKYLKIRDLPWWNQQMFWVGSDTIMHHRLSVYQCSCRSSPSFMIIYLSFTIQPPPITTPFHSPFSFIIGLPSGELTFCHGKSPFLMGTSTISMAIFNSYMLVHQAG